MLSTYEKQEGYTYYISRYKNNKAKKEENVKQQKGLWHDKRSRAHITSETRQLSTVHTLYKSVVLSSYY